MSLFASSAIIGSITLVSRLFGFLRDVLIANFLGAGMQTDAFFVAFKLPNFMRRLFAEGAFNSAFLPMFAGMLKTEGQEKSLRFAAEVQAVLLTILAALCAVAIIAMPWVLLLLAPGFADDPEKFDLTVSLTRITFPYLLFISLVCLLSGLLNSVGRFAAVAAAPILLNLALIFGIFILSSHVGSAYGLAYGVVIAGMSQLLWVGYFCYQEGIFPRLQAPHYTPHVKKLLKLLAPAAIGAGVVQLNLLIDVILASTMDKAVSYLYYADRIYELPLGVIGIAVATALLPMLSKQIRAGQQEEAQASLNQALMLIMLFGLPSTAALLVIADPIIRVVFEHGAFSAEDRLATYPALIAYACGLPAFLLIKLFATGFYAAQDTKTPVKIAIIAVVTNLVLNFILMQYYQHVGLAMATSIAAWLNAGLLGWILYRKDSFKPDHHLSRFIIKIIVSCFMMIFVLSLLDAWLAAWWQQGLIMEIGGMALLVFLGAITFFVGLFLMRATSLSELKGWLKTS